MMWRTAKSDRIRAEAVAGRVRCGLGHFYAGNVALTLFKFETVIFLTDLI